MWEGLEFHSVFAIPIPRAVELAMRAQVVQLACWSSMQGPRDMDHSELEGIQSRM